MMLQEGLVKLPLKLKAMLHETAISAFLTYLHVEAAKLGKPALALVEDELRLREYHLRSDVATGLAKGRVEFTKLLNFDDHSYGEHIVGKLRVVVSFGDSARWKNSHGVHWATDKVNSIYISAKALGLIPSKGFVSIALVRAAIRGLVHFESVLDHELTHLVQHRVFEPKGAHLPVDYTEDDAFGAAYIMSATEFDPLIKTAIGRAKRMIHRLSYNDDYTLRKFLDGYVCVTPPPEWLERVSPFFYQLKKLDHAKWKKAVKLFMGEFDLSSVH